MPDGVSEVRKPAAHRLPTLLLICLVLGPPSTAQAPPASEPRVFDVRSYGAKGDGNSLDTHPIQQAIRAAHAAGGGRVVFPPGTYLTGTIELLSNVTLDLQSGSVLLGSSNLADYGSISQYGFAHEYGLNSTGEGERVGIIVARNVENVAIVGQGAIDGNADIFYDFQKPHYGLDFDPQYTRQGKDFLKSILELGDGPVETKSAGRPGTMIVFTQAKGVLIRDVTLRNAPNWTLHLNQSQRAIIHGIHIVNSLLLPNNDGIDCLGCRNVHVSDCDIAAGDDDFAFYGSQDIGVENCSLVSHSAGIRLENTRYGTFSNLTIHSNRGIGIFERTGTTAHLTFTNIAMETQLLTGHWWGKAEPIFIAVGPPQEAHVPEVRDVHFLNIFGEAEAGMVVYGDEKARIHNLTFDQVRIRIRAPRKTVAQLAGGNFDFRWTAQNLSRAVFQHDIPGLYFRYVDSFRIHGLRLEWAKDLPDYFSDGIEAEDFRGLTLDRFEGSEAKESGGRAAIVLRRGEGVSVTNSSALPGTTTFLLLENVRGEGLFLGNDLRLAKHAFAPDSGSFKLFGNLMPGEK
ncbi:MAG TPA: glycosyl hydrolase family 28-related protein [Candidatus Limnocylindrales bacterium]|nr:glycosyl hydrolase family 28-related protein [Candidatus Limnocylindrales bacterium]